MFRCRECNLSTAFESIMQNHIKSHPFLKQAYYNDTAPEDLHYNPFRDDNASEITNDISIPDPVVIDSGYSGGGGDFGGGGASGDF